MIRQLFISINALLMLFAANAMADTGGSCFADASLAIENKNFELAEIILMQHLKHGPKDTEARFLLARVLSWQDKWVDALEHFNELLEEQSDSADFLLARANTLEWMGHRKKALQDLEKARGLSPGDSEIWRTEIIILVRGYNPDNRNQAKVLATEANQKFPDVDWDSLLIPEEKKTIVRNNYAAAVSYGHDELTNNRSSWEAASMKLTMQTPEKHFAHVQLDKNKRFDLDDSQIGGGYALPFAHSWYFYAGAAYSPTHRFLANRMLETRISKSFPGKFNLHVGLSHAKYSETNSQQSYLTGEYYWPEFRVAYTYRLIDIKNAGTGHNHNIQLNKYYSSVNMIGASIAEGDDVEFDGTPNPPISDVISYSIYGQHMLQPQWTVIYSLTYHEQGDFYNRNGFVLGIKFDF